jgi:hypothetical protein
MYGLMNIKKEDTLKQMCVYSTWKLKVTDLLYVEGHVRYIRYQLHLILYYDLHTSNPI